MSNRKQPTPPPMNQRKPVPPPPPPPKRDLDRLVRLVVDAPIGVGSDMNALATEVRRLRTIIDRASVAADDSHLIQMDGAKYLGVRKQLRDVAAILGEA